jgi:hypothetical protein
LRGCNISNTDQRDLGVAVETASYGMIYIPSFMETGAGIQTNIKVFPQKFDGL